MIKTEKKRIKIWDSKWFLCLFSVIVAVTLWFFVSINYGAIETAVISDVPINIDFSEVFQRDGLELIDIVSPENLVDKKMDVKVKGKKLVINQMSRDDVAITAQVSHITTAGTQALSLKYECTNPLFDVNFASDNPSSMVVFVDRISEKTFDTVSVDIKGSYVTEDGFLAENPYSNLSIISLSGPESIINKIASVAVTTTVDGTLEETSSFDGQLVFYDADGNLVDDTYITHSFTDNITVTIPVKMTKTLKLALKFKNAPVGYAERMLSHTISPSSITVKGSRDAITAAFESDTLVIGEVDFAKLSKSNNPMTFPINLSSGIELTEEITEVSVKFDLSNISSKTMSISKDETKFNIINNAENHIAEIKSATLNNITVYGLPSQLRKLGSSDFLVTVDLADKDSYVGNCIVKATITVPGRDKCWVVGTYDVEVSIRNAQ